LQLLLQGAFLAGQQRDVLAGKLTHFFIGFAQEAFIVFKLSENFFVALILFNNRRQFCPFAGKALVAFHVFKDPRVTQQTVKFLMPHYNFFEFVKHLFHH